MPVDVKRFADDTGGAYVPAFTAASRDDALAALRCGQRWNGETIVQPQSVSEYPGFWLIWCTLSDGTTHSFMVPL